MRKTQWWVKISLSYSSLDLSLKTFIYCWWDDVCWESVGQAVQLQLLNPHLIQLSIVFLKCSTTLAEILYELIFKLHIKSQLFRMESELVSTQSGRWGPQVLRKTLNISDSMNSVKSKWGRGRDKGGWRVVGKARLRKLMWLTG